MGSNSAIFIQRSRLSDSLYHTIILKTVKLNLTESHTNAKLHDSFTSMLFYHSYHYLQGAALPQWVMHWPTDLVVPSSSSPPGGSSQQ